MIHDKDTLGLTGAHGGTAISALPDCAVSVHNECFLDSPGPLSDRNPQPQLQHTHYMDKNVYTKLVSKRKQG